MNYSFLATTYEKNIIIHTVVTLHGADKVTYHEKIVKQKLFIIFFYQKYVDLGETTFIHCSWITVALLLVDLKWYCN